MSKTRKPIRSDMAWSTPERIVVRGKDLPSEILGHFNLGDMAFLELTGRAPSAQESTLFNAMVVTLVEHGLTPSAIAARMTYFGAPEAMQAAVAAGLCGLGSVFVVQHARGDHVAIDAHGNRAHACRHPHRGRNRRPRRFTYWHRATALVLG